MEEWWEENCHQVCTQFIDCNNVLFTNTSNQSQLRESFSLCDWTWLEDFRMFMINVFATVTQQQLMESFFV